MSTADIVIVGTGHGGAQAAMALRQKGFTGSILMIGRDQEPPYARPPLSKEYLAKEKPFDRLYIRPPQFWSDKKVNLKLNTAVTEVKPDSRSLILSDGGTAKYGKLVWAAGGDPRALSVEGADLAGIYSIRNRSDVDGIMEELDAGAKKIVVIGGGYIGLEAAAVLIKLGREVTLLEALNRVLARVAGEDLSRFYEDEHRAHGLDLRTGTAIEAIEGSDGKVTGVRLAGGETVPADIVIVGIGIVPTVAPLIAAGATGSNGVAVDAYCQTSLKDVYAIGDCAAHANQFAEGSIIRLESVQNANDMANTVAQHVTGDAKPYDAVPWFWSNQYDLKLQTVGLNLGYDQTILRGDPESRSFSVIYLRGGRVVALDCVNAMKDFVQGRKLVEAKAAISADLLQDPAIPLKQLLPA